MNDNDLLILRSDEVAAIIDGREVELIDVVKLVYEAHARGKSSLPHSTFLRFPDDERNRIIALPAYLGESFDVAGIKWVSSFPGNLDCGLDRASAAIILNSSLTGRPEALIEGSVISAKRTAASAALAAQYLHEEETNRLGIIGCGPINFEIARFILAARSGIKRLVVFDLDYSRAEQYKTRCEGAFNNIEVIIVNDLRDALKECQLISFATTAIKPYVFDLSDCAPSSTILHISLRDLSPQVILSCDNIVDDLDHVCRAQTSIHLAEQLTGNRGFVRCTLADITLGEAAARRNGQSIAVFSPFGLGVLDIAVSKIVMNLAQEQGLGTRINSFLPASWRREKKTDQQLELL